MKTPYYLVTICNEDYSGHDTTYDLTYNLWKDGQSNHVDRFLCSSEVNQGVIQPMLEKKINEAGSFTFTLLATHPLANDIHSFRTYVDIYIKGRHVFRGLVRSISEDMFRQKNITCEGALGFVADQTIEKGRGKTQSTWTRQLRASMACLTHLPPSTNKRSDNRYPAKRFMLAGIREFLASAVNYEHNIENVLMNVPVIKGKYVVSGNTARYSEETEGEKLMVTVSRPIKLSELGITAGQKFNTEAFTYPGDAAAGDEGARNNSALGVGSDDIHVAFLNSSGSVISTSTGTGNTAYFKEFTTPANTDSIYIWWASYGLVALFVNKPYSSFVDDENNPVEPYEIENDWEAESYSDFLKDFFIGDLGGMLRCRVTDNIAVTRPGAYRFESIPGVPYGIKPISIDFPYESDDKPCWVGGQHLVLEFLSPNRQAVAMADTPIVEIANNIINMSQDNGDYEPYSIADIVADDGRNYLEKSESSSDDKPALQIPNWDYFEKFGPIRRIVNVGKRIGNDPSQSKLTKEATNRIKKIWKLNENDLQTQYSITALDSNLYFDNEKMAMIDVGDSVIIRSKLHNIDIVRLCLSMKLDLLNPENNEYVVGKYINDEEDRKMDTLTKILSKKKKKKKR